MQCFALLDLIVEKGEVRTQNEVTSLKMGGPDPAAFQVPGGYKIVSPVGFEELWKKKYDGRNYFGEKALGRLEREYEEGRSRLAGPAAK